MTPDLSGCIGEIAQRLLGEPNKALSTRGQLRFGTNGSVAVEIAGPKRGQWYDHEAQIGGGPWEMLHIKGQFSDGRAEKWVRDNLGIEIGPKTNGAASSERQRQKQYIVKTYYYYDEKDALLFKVDRWGPKKTFSQHPPDGKGGWKKGKGAMRGVRLVPYRLPDLVAAKASANGAPWRVYIFEGEKDVDNVVRRWGVTATTNPMGAGKWRPEFNRHFAGSDAVIIGDNDETGRAHVAKVAAELRTVASIVRTVELGGLDEHGDISDWIEVGGTRDRFEALVEAASVFRPGAVGARKGHDKKQAPAPERRSIHVTAGLLHQVADEGLAVMASAGVSFYQRDKKLVRVCLIKAKNCDGEYIFVPGVVPVSSAIIRRSLGQSARWEKSNAKGEVIQIDPPRDVVDQIAGMVGEWPFPPLSGIIATPTLRADGSLLDRRGYDPQTGWCCSSVI